jgi:hypothetical protein
MAIRQQALDEMTANKSGAAGNETLHDQTRLGAPECPEPFQPC